MMKLLKYFLLGLLLSQTSGVLASFDYKISDAIAPFFDEKEEIRHFSSIPFYQLDTSKKPYVDEAQFESIKEKFSKYIENVQLAGYTHITLDDINHLVLGTQYAIYRNSPKLTRHKKYRELYHTLISQAKEKGLGVFLVSDMQFYTQEVERQFDISKPNDELEKFDIDMIEEVLREFPDIEGVIVRVGEGGNAYNTEEYKSKILYRTPESINAFLKKLIPIFEDRGKKLIVRTWSIGAGSIGDFVINPKTYEAVFKDISSKNILASVKITPGDFFDFPEKNPTIGYGKIPQIVEMEVRKEYEGGGDFPNYVGEEYSQNLKYLLEKKNIVGVWNWNQTGGWGWGHNVLFNFGFTFWNEINFWTVGELLKGETDHEVAMRTAVIKLKRKYGLTFKQIDDIQEILRLSKKVIQNNWYIPNFRNKNYSIFGVRVPPLLYIWWDRPTKSPLVLSFIAYTIGQDIGGEYETTQKYVQKIQDLREKSKGSPIMQDILFSLDNQIKIFELLKNYRRDFLHFYTTGEKQSSEVPKLIFDYEIFSEGKNIARFDTREMQLFYVQAHLQHLYLLLMSSFLFFIALIGASFIGIVFDVLSFDFKKKKLLYFFTLLSIFIGTIFLISGYKNGYLVYRFLWDVYFMHTIAILLLVTVVICMLSIFWVGIFAIFSLREPKKGNAKLGYIGLFILYIFFTAVLFVILVFELLKTDVEKFLPSYFKEAGTSIDEII